MQGSRSELSPCKFWRPWAPQRARSNRATEARPWNSARTAGQELNFSLIRRKAASVVPGGAR